MSEDQAAIADAGDAGAADQAAGETTSAPESYQLPASLRGFEDQIRPEHLRQIEEMGREQGWSQQEFDALATEAFGDPAGQRAALEQAFGAKTAETLQAVATFAGELSKHHGEAVARLSASAAGVKLLNDLRVAGAGGLDLAKHGGAVQTLRATEAGRELLKSLQVAGEGVAMPGVPAAERRPAAQDRATEEVERAPQKTADELAGMMRDPRYWRDRDPAFQAEVTRGFEALYPDQVQTAAIAPTGSRR